MKTWTELREKIESKFPKFADELCITSNKETINEISLLIGEELPSSFISIYNNCNGEKNRGAGYIFGLSLLSTEKIIHELKSWKEIIDDGLDGLSDSCSSKDLGKVKCEYANTKWLPLIGDWSGNFIGLDFDPGPKGHKGQVINFGRDEEDKYVFADSLDEFLLLLGKLLDTPKVTVSDDGDYSYDNVHFIDALKIA